MSRAMRRRAFLSAASRVALGVALCPVTACSPPVRTSQSKVSAKLAHLIADLETRIPRLMTDDIVPGLSIVLVREAQVVWRRGFGVIDSATKAPVDSETVFEAGSMSKPVFAYAVLKLCETGVLNLDTPLTKYTPDRFLTGDPRLDRITARHVLSHTSGFPNWRSSTEPLAIQFDPGTRWRYSGEGYSYLQSVVTHLTGHVDANACGTFEADLKVCATDIAEYMDTHVVVPLGMSSSGYVWNTAAEDRVARPHDASGAPFARKDRRTATADAIGSARYAAAGGLHATPADYAQFLIEVISPKQSDAFRLTEATVAEMIRPVVKVPDEPHPGSWALGWQVFHTRYGDVIAHGGDGGGFHSFAAASVANQTAFVLMTNGENGWKIREKLAYGEAMDSLLSR